jgi:2-polyprenyl-3-methyl-5-hydroxy-6-metoxy-1,4-benzoquinol methylase
VAANFKERMYESYVSSGQAAAPASIEDLQCRAPFLRNVIERHFPDSRDATIIDLGCGYGYLVHFAREAGYSDTRGVDFSAEQVATAARLGIEGVSQGDALATLNFLPDGSQQVVTTFDVIEHLRKDELFPFADEVLRVLEPGGRWIITVPNGESPFFGRVRHADLTHELAFTRISMAQFLGVAGFREIESFENAPVPHGLVSRLRWLLWKGIRALLGLYIAAETGELGGGIFTQNFTTVAKK